jgi:hypothetical protein
MPAGFWTEYKKHFIEKNSSDQGPWGGKRIIHWKAEKPNAIVAKEMLDFASGNGWLIVDSLHFPANRLKEMKIFGEDISQINNFPKQISPNCTIYRFKTNWSLYEPGTDNSTDENGFVMITDDGTQMCVYHSWGE